MKKPRNSSVWTVEFKRSAARELKKFPRKTRIHIIEIIENVLMVNPFAGDKLHGQFKGLWRFRTGNYIIICQIEEKKLIILIVKIAHRKEAYSLPS